MSHIYAVTIEPETLSYLYYIHADSEDDAIAAGRWEYDHHESKGIIVGIRLADDDGVTRDFVADHDGLVEEGYLEA